MANHAAYLLSKIISKVSNDTNVMMIGRIEDYNKKDNMATVELLHNNPSTVTQYPPLIKVPCAFISMGGFKIQALPKKNDRVLIIYCDYDIENLLIDGTITPKSNRNHSLNDAIAIPLKINFLNDEDLKSPINDGELIIGNSKGHIQITDDGKINLNSASGGTLDLSTIQEQLNQVSSDFTNFSSDNYLTNIEANTLKNDLKKLQTESIKLVNEGTSLGLTQYVTNYQTALDNLNTELTNNWIDKTNYPLVITAAQRNNIITLLSNVEMNKTFLTSEINMQITANANSYADSKLNNFVTEVYSADKNDLQSQIDGEIQTWFYAGTPTFDNEPAKEWTDDNAKNKHTGDLYYDTNTGYAYRFALISSAYQWKLITDSDVTKALADAAKAQDTADHKRRVFTTTPVPPYDTGDLWVQGSNGDALVCETAKTEEQAYAQGDFVTATKYTDDTRANEAKAAADNAQGDANKANTMLDAMSDDGKITPSEKIKLKQEWDIVQSEANTTNGAIYMQATTYNVDTTAYEGAYATVSKYLSDNDIFAYMGLISTIDRTTWDNDWKAYYNERTKLLNKISDVIQDNVNTTNQSITTVSKHVTDLADKIGYSIESNTFTTNGVLQSLQTTQTFVEQNKDHISSTVTKTDVQNAVGNIQIGGTNLIRNSNFSQGSVNWYSNGFSNFQSANDLPIGALYGGKFAIPNEYKGFYQMAGTAVNQVYTLTMYAKADTPVNMMYGCEGIQESQITLTTSWAKYSYSFVGDGNIHAIVFYPLEACTLYITNIKLEQGNKSTGWSPAPEDQSAYTDSAINDVQIGGTNLWINGSFESQDPYVIYNPNAWTVSRRNDRYANLIPTDGSYTLFAYTTFSSTANSWFGISDTNGWRSIKPNTQYTVSFDFAWDESGGSVTDRNCFVIVRDINGIWAYTPGIPMSINDYRYAFKRCSYTFTTPNNVKDMCLGFGLTATAGTFTWLQVDRIQLEEGNKATSWRTASGDTQSQISGVTLTNMVGVTGDSSLVTKNVNASWGNAGCSSVETLAEGDYIEYTIGANSGSTQMVGLSHTDTDQNYSTIQYAWYTERNNHLYIYESGTNVVDFGANTWSAGDKFRISIEQSKINYYHNGTFVRASQSIPTQPLVLDLSIYDPNSSILSITKGHMIAGLSTRISTAESKIEENANAIKLRVTTETYSTGISAVNSNAQNYANAAQTNAVNSAKSYTDSEFSVLDGKITSKVSSTDYTGNTLVSMINQSSSKINMSALNIDLSGYVTFNNLATAGQTTIDGGNIKADTVVAKELKTASADVIVSTGTWQKQGLSSQMLNVTGLKLVTSSNVELFKVGSTQDQGHSTFMDVDGDFVLKDTYRGSSGGYLNIAAGIVQLGSAVSNNQHVNLALMNDSMQVNFCDTSSGYKNWNYKLIASKGVDTQGADHYIMGSYTIDQVVFAPNHGYINFHDSSDGSNWGVSCFASDISLKTNISDSTEDALSKLCAIPIRQWTWKDGLRHQRLGIVSQEARQIDESFAFGVKQDDGSIRYQPDATILIPYLIKSIQQLENEFNVLKNNNNLR